MSKETLTEEPIEVRRPLFRKPISVILQEAWQDMVNSFMLSLFGMFPKRPSRCQSEGHVMPKTKAVYSRCEECGTNIIPGSTRIRACSNVPSQTNGVKMHIWPDE